MARAGTPCAPVLRDAFRPARSTAQKNSCFSSMPYMRGAS